MPNNLIITGRTGIGKTALIKRIIKDLAMLLLRGYYTEPIYENEISKGFRVNTMDYQEQILAHVYIEGPYHIKGFGVNVEGFEKLVLPQLDVNEPCDLFIIDEISRLSCMSEKFRALLPVVFNSEIPVVSTMSLVSDPGMQKLMKMKGVTVIQMTESNKESLWKNVLMNLK